MTRETGQTLNYVAGDGFAFITCKPTTTTWLICCQDIVVRETKTAVWQSALMGEMFYTHRETRQNTDTALQQHPR